MNQDEYLREQSAIAVDAMKSTVADAKEDAKKLLDPRIWVKSHPWKSLAVASAVGFVAGQALRKPAKEDETPAAAVKPAETKPAAESKLRGLVMTFLKQGSRILLALAQPILQEVLAAYSASHNGSATTGKAYGPSPVGGSGAVGQSDYSGGTQDGGPIGP